MSKAEVRYNVYCMDCGQVFQPLIKSALWWKAKKRSDEGYIDALSVRGKDCGCIEEKREPNAPFRVFGYTEECRDFDYPFQKFTEAVTTFRELNNDAFLTVFITGISPSVEHVLKTL